ncbi:MAG: DNA polymerase I [candidate division KSB1 bacterium]|nr:DNA polymerase I [candidate division KSB1 bacterium]MDZ7304481.1 DNA polymerase I [candidate division KSB1 bacterium]MDZ7312988.1 DNA polymerase I [candidate division KSB1 bacterium]
MPRTPKRAFEPESRSQSALPLKDEPATLAPRAFFVDGSALAYRAHFAFIRNPLTNSRGQPTSAIFGFVRALLKLIDEEHPEYLAVVFDTPEPTFRHKTYAEYKATRQKMSDDLLEQLPMIRSFCEALGAKVIELPGYEADDVMGTLAKRVAEQNIDTYLVTGDKDFMQLVGPHTFIYNTGRGEKAEILDADGVQQKIGLPPHRIVDFLALMGDTSDNVPGVPKIGEKTARDLLLEYDTIENLLAQADSIKRANIRDSLKEHREQALLSKKLVTIDTNAPLSLRIEDLARREIDSAAAAALCREFEFSSLLSRFTVAGTAAEAKYQLLDTPEKVNWLAQKLAEVECFAFDTETTAENPLLAELVGMSFAWEEGSAYYVPVAPPDLGSADSPSSFSDFFLQSATGNTGFSLKKVLAPLLEDPHRPKCGQNAKYDMLVMSRYGVHLRGVVFDTMIASYLLNPSSRQHNLDALSLEYLNYKKIPTHELIGSGKTQMTMREVPVAKVAHYACEDADFTFRLRNHFAPKLRAAGLSELFEKVEMPLVEVLAAVERTGVALDLPFLKKMSMELEATLGMLMAEVYELAGEEFNLNSPKQLEKILFDKLKLPASRRTKTGRSTDADVLERLAPYHDLPKKLLEYRELAKLKSTYVEALPQLVNPFTRRVHTSYNQAIAVTGRLSSSEPNLQNIPIRTEVGRQIRRAFIPGEKGWKLLDADYSQIELRIVAHLSKDAALIEAFRNDEDIHTSTAARVFNVDPREMTPEIRRRAKEINFGIIYGMGAYGLSQRLGITPEEAQNFITNYFVQYPGVNALMMGLVAEAHKKGYVTTLLNRRRYLPDINSDNRRMREFAERTAINTPIQGTAADLIKIAMINIHRRLQEKNMRSRMILQVHDELVFEAPEEELTDLGKLVREEMSQAIRLDVPIKVDIGIGENWLEAH